MEEENTMLDKAEFIGMSMSLYYGIYILAGPREIMLTGH